MSVMEGKDLVGHGLLLDLLERGRGSVVRVGSLLVLQVLRTARAGERPAAPNAKEKGRR